MSKLRRPQQTAILDRYALRFQEFKREFQQLEYFCKGTLLQRMMKCGKAQCACAHNPGKRHGPYFEWTYKAKGKTVNVKLTQEATSMYLQKRHPCICSNPYAATNRKTADIL